MNAAPLPTWRVPLVRDVFAYTGAESETEYRTVQAPNSLSARLIARAQTGAAAALMPVRVS